MWSRRALACLIIVMLTPGFSHVSQGHEENKASSVSLAYPQISGQYMVLVHLDYFICDPNLDPWIAGDPDPYFVVHVNEQSITTPVYDGMHEIYLNLNLSFTLYPDNPVVLIRIEAWDDDSGLTLGDDEIDIDPGVGTALDLWYNLITKSWCGDTNTTLALGDAQQDWGKLAFYIDSEAIVQPEQGNVFFTYLNAEPVYIDGMLKSSFRNIVKEYSISLSSGQSITFNFYTLPSLYVSVKIYKGLQLIADNNFTGSWHTSFYADGSSYSLKIICLNGSGVVETGYCAQPYYTIPSHRVSAMAEGNVEVISNGSNFVMLRMFGLSGKIGITNLAGAGNVFLMVRNIEPDMFEFHNASIVSLGRNSVLLAVAFSTAEMKNVEIVPWYMPDDYWYVFMSDSQPHFTTPPGGNVKQSVHFLNIINQTNIVNPPFILHAGDYVDGLGCMDEDYMYGTGYTSPVNDYEYGELLKALAYMRNFLASAVGNHDVSRGHTQGLGEALYKEWLSPLYYSFDYGALHVVILDTYEDQDSWWFLGDTGMYGGYIYGNQKNWLFSDISSNTNPLKVAVMHHSLALPPNPDSDWTLNETFINRTNALEIFHIFEGNISQVYCGHIHDYAVYNLSAMQNDVVSTNLSGLPCIMAGTAGGDLDNHYFPHYGFIMAHVKNASLVEHYFIREDQFGISVSYNASNESQSCIRADIVNTGMTIPWMRLKFVVSSEYEHYVAYSLTKNVQLPVFAHNYGNYTVIYVHAENLTAGTESIVVTPLKGVQIDMSKVIVVLPNSTVFIQHNITNLGYAGENITLSVVANLTDWNVSIVDEDGYPISEIYIPGRSTATIYVRVIVPEGADGDVCGILVNASIKDMPGFYSAVRDEAHCMQLTEWSGAPVLILATLALLFFFRKFYRVGRI